MQAINVYMRPVRQLIEDPKNAVHIELLGRGEFSQRAVPRQQSPAAQLGDRKRKGVGGRKLDMLTIYYGCPQNFDWCQFLDPQAKLYQPVAKFTEELSCKEQVGHSKLEWQ